MREIEKQVIQQLRHGPIQTTGHIRAHIPADIEYSELHNLLNQMVEEEKIEYGHGEYGEYTLPDGKYIPYNDP